MNVNGSKYKCTCNIVIFKDLITYTYENDTFNVTLSNCKYIWNKCKYQYILCYNCKYCYNPLYIINCKCK